MNVNSELISSLVFQLCDINCIHIGDIQKVIVQKMAWEFSVIRAEKEHAEYQMFLILQIRVQARCPGPGIPWSIF